jgi:hypothetical protein
MRVIGGMNPKEKHAMLKTQEGAWTLYQKLLKQKGWAEAQRETIAWLLKQPGVVTVRLEANRDLSVQYTSGIRMMVEAPAAPPGR